MDMLQNIPQPYIPADTTNTIFLQGMLISSYLIDRYRVEQQIEIAAVAATLPTGSSGPSSPFNGEDDDDDWAPIWLPNWPESPEIRWPAVLNELPEPPASALLRDQTLPITEHVRLLIAKKTVFVSALRNLGRHENIFKTGEYKRFREREDVDEWRRLLPTRLETRYRRARLRRGELTRLDGRETAEETSRLAFVAWFLRQLHGPMNKYVLAITAITERLRQLGRFLPPAPAA